jgi:hypothetical protein
MILVLYSLFGLAADIPQEVLYALNSNKPPSQPIICLAVGRVEPQSKGPAGTVGCKHLTS